MYPSEYETYESQNIYCIYIYTYMYIYMLRIYLLDKKCKSLTSSFETLTNINTQIKLVIL